MLTYEYRLGNTRNTRHAFQVFFFFQAEDGIRDLTVTGVQTCALPIFSRSGRTRRAYSHATERAQAPRPAQSPTSAETTSPRPARSQGTPPICRLRLSPVAPSCHGEPAARVGMH